MTLPVPPVNANASVPARRLLAYIYQLQGNHLLSGQHEFLEAPDTYARQIQGLTGKFPAVHGYEMGAIMNQDQATIAAQRGKVTDSAIAWYKAGGLVTMMYHAHYPGTAPTWANVQRTSTTQQEFNQIVTPGTTLYNSLIADIDKVAVFLGRLRDAGVPVLWRPYHEMNGGWFWWGKKNNYAALWNIMYSRYTDHHHLDNLLWVWNANAPNAYADPYAGYYPGSNRVDILAADIYNNDFKQSHHDGLIQLGGGKPIAIGENGELPNPDTLRTSQPMWTWFMTWGNYLREKNSDAVIRFVYAHPYVLTRDEVNPANFPDPTEPGEPGEPEPTPGTGLIGRYYSDMNFGALRLTRIDPVIRFNWGRGSPAASIPSDNFSVRWTGAIKPEFTETYTFYTSSDDGVRLWVNNRLIIDKWIDQPSTQWSAAIGLTAGMKVPIRLEYYENRGDASIVLSWSSARTPKQVVPQSSLYPDDTSVPPAPPPPGDGLTGRYYADRSFTALRMTRIDPTVNFNWGRQSPAASLPADGFSVRWSGSIIPQYSGLYTFYTVSDDGVRLKIDNRLIIDKWIDQPSTQWSAAISLTAGERYSLQLDYYENRGEAAIALYWSHANQPKQIVPQVRLYSS